MQQKAKSRRLIYVYSCHWGYEGILITTRLSSFFFCPPIYAALYQNLNYCFSFSVSTGVLDVEILVKFMVIGKCSLKAVHVFDSHPPSLPLSFHSPPLMLFTEEIFFVHLPITTTVDQVF